MDKSDRIKVVYKNVQGINNPKAFFCIKMDSKNFEIEVLSDSKKIDYECRSLGDNKIEVSAVLPEKVRSVELNIIINKQKYKVCKVYNLIALRILNKIRGVLNKVTAKLKTLFYVIYKGIKFMWREYHFLVPISMWKKYIHDFKERLNGASSNYLYNPFYVDEYNKWLRSRKQKTDYEDLSYRPLISILIPVYNIKRKYLSECIDSILNQTYDNFEVCLVDDCSSLKEVKETLDEYSKKDKRIRVKYRTENGHISRTTNDALKMAKGEYIALMDNDDTLDKDALYEVVRALNKDKTIDFIYSDEDKIGLKGEYRDPNFKPDYSPDTLLSLNYICHLAVIRRKIVEEVGGFEVGLEGAQDHDLFLKVVEKTNKIYHIPEILYHWRMVEGSTSLSIDNKSYANDKGKIAIENALKRRGLFGKVEKDIPSTYYRVVYELKKEPLVSIIIPTRDHVDILKKCVESIFKKTRYKNFEVIIANNGSVENTTIKYFKECQKKHKNVKIFDINIKFNYSLINNKAIKDVSKGDYVVLLNNDTEIISPDWLTEMIGYASLPHVGAVGAKLLYPDRTVQHAGVILGLGGVASHAYIGAKRDDLGMYGRLRVPYNYSANTAACIAIKKSKYFEVGGLEEDLEVAYNDVDFNIKLLKKGYYNVFLPQVELIHYESKSRGLDTTSEKYKRFLKESNYMYEKWGDMIEIDPFYNKNFSKKGVFMLDKN